MERYQGKTVVNGIVTGKIFIYVRDQFQIEKKYIADSEKEILRYREAKDFTIQQFAESYDKAVELVGAKSASIFEMQSILLKEGKFSNLVEKMIRDEKVSASYAVAEIVKQLISDYQIKEDWEKEEKMNLRELGKRLLKVLKGENHSEVLGQKPVILCTKELSPEELLQFDCKNIAGIVTEYGTMEDHTSVLAAAMKLPYITGISFRSAWKGKTAVLDGEKQRLLIEPDQENLTKIQRRKANMEKRNHALNSLREEKTVTLDGVRVSLYANIGNSEEIDEVLRCRADGIGLFRSEFLYMGRETYPSEEEQFQYYRMLAEKMQGRPVTIRTLDIGADKQMGYLRMEQEENPALGYRGIRISLEQEELFRTQLKAIYRAAVYGKLQILYPMITSVQEIDKIQEIIEDIKEEMDAKQIAYGTVCQGVMIETPAAVMISDMLAEKVDFFSIGTNDLIQYTMAADRQNVKVAHLCNPSHPAVLRMITMAVKNGHKYHLPVTICGEMAGNLQMTQKLVEMGVDILSVTPQQILPVRQAIREVSIRSVY